jgi:hypothetical protein
MFRLAPTPRDGELLYSVLARLGGYLNAADSAPFMLSLVGRRGAVASPDLPGGLAHLVRDLPAGMREASVDRIIDRLTLFPFHTAFMPVEVRDGVRQAMRGDVTGVYTRLGLATFKVRQPARLRFCLDCLDGMERDHADLWWRREHQLAGVPVCAIHGTVLRMSDVATGERNRHSFVAASRKVCRMDAELAIDDVRGELLARLQGLAKAAVDLLDQPPRVEGHQDRRDGYRRRLGEVGLMRSARKVDVAALHAAFAGRWGGMTEVIDGLQLGDDVARSWLTAMVRARPRAVHPLQHLMLIGMLDDMQAVEADAPFGPGPWPCRNPIAGHTGEPTITAATVRRDRDVTYGDFACGCGYLYTVARSPDGTLGRPRYRRFGPTFAPALREAIAAGHSLRQAARTLGLDPKTLVREAAMAGIEVAWATKASGALPAPQPAKAPTMGARRQVRRARLRRNWFAIDARLERSARSAGAVIMAEHPPCRVTHAEVERRIARRDWIMKRRAKLPRTVAAITGMAESVDDFRRRRLAHHVATAADLRPCEVLRIVGLPMSWLPEVRDVVAVALRRGRAVA